MKRMLAALTVVVLVGSAFAVGCGKQASSSSEAIQVARAKDSPQVAAKYLVAQAKGFLRAKKYDEAIKTAQHVLSSFDVESERQAAQLILADAKDRMAKEAKGAVDRLNKQLGL